jgi:hypothetical protein
MRHFIVKMISTSTEKEEEHEGELKGTDVERGFIDLARASFFFFVPPGYFDSFSYT